MTLMGRELLCVAILKWLRWVPILYWRSLRTEAGVRGIPSELLNKQESLLRSSGKRTANMVDCTQLDVFRDCASFMDVWGQSVAVIVFFGSIWVYGWWMSK